jgi:hypothetical protein
LISETNLYYPDIVGFFAFSVQISEVMHSQTMIEIIREFLCRCYVRNGGAMGSVPPNVGVFFGKADKRSEGWYWTEALVIQKAAKGPFETKEQAIENAIQSLAAQGPNDGPGERGAA